MLTGVHVLLTYKCTNECDHCFLHCSPRLEGTFSAGELRQLIAQVNALPTVRWVYFEGGEPFLFYTLLLTGLRLARSLGLDTGVVTNAYWATSVEDALACLRPLRDLGVADLSISDDEFHRSSPDDHRAGYAMQAARQLGIPCDSICIQAPQSAKRGAATKGEPVTGGGVLFRGRAAEKLTEGQPLRSPVKLAECPHEELLHPKRVHVDVYGNVHLCQGLSMGNFWKTPLPEMIACYDAHRHPIAGPLLRGGPAQLAAECSLPLAAGYVDECHLCYEVRKALVPRFPEFLAPREAYGMER